MLLPDKVARWLARGMFEITDYCWIWKGCTNSDGYPKVSYKGDVNSKGHRVVYALFNPSDNIEGKCIRHKCDNILCINPEHLESGSQLDNIRDRHTRKRTYNQVHPEEVEAVVSLRNTGMCYNDIAYAVNISRKRVEYILTRIA
jgi:hypothetical protein